MTNNVSGSDFAGHLARYVVIALCIGVLGASVLSAKEGESRRRRADHLQENLIDCRKQIAELRNELAFDLRIEIVDLVP